MYSFIRPLSLACYFVSLVSKNAGWEPKCLGLDWPLSEVGTRLEQQICSSPDRLIIWACFPGPETENTHIIKSHTRHLLEMAWRKVHGWITQLQLTMIISTAIQNITEKVWTDSSVSVNFHPCHHLSFSEWIKKIAPYVKSGETVYFRNHEGS